MAERDERTKEEILLASNHPHIYFTTRLGGRAQWDTKKGKLIFIEAPINGEYKVDDEVPLTLTTWPCCSPLLEFP